MSWTPCARSIMRNVSSDCLTIGAATYRGDPRDRHSSYLRSCASLRAKQLSGRVQIVRPGMAVETGVTHIGRQTAWRVFFSKKLTSAGPPQNGPSKRPLRRTPLEWIEIGDECIGWHVCYCYGRLVSPCPDTLGKRWKSLKARSACSDEAS